MRVCLIEPNIIEYFVLLISIFISYYTLIADTREIPQRWPNLPFFNRLWTSNVPPASDLPEESAILAQSKDYDYIVIGGGAAGCPLARTLADSGKEVLLIERGGPRKDHPDTLDIYDAGWVISNPEVSQLVQTTEGVRSHIGSVLSGGTGINMAILIAEVKQYYDYLASNYGAIIDIDKMSDATRWITNKTAHHSFEVTPQSEAWRNSLNEVYGAYRGANISLNMNHSWESYSLFDKKKNFYRNAADVTLGIKGKDFPSKIRLLLRHTVQKIYFQKDPIDNNQTIAKCVLVQRTSDADIAPIMSGQGWNTTWKKLAFFFGLIPPTSEKIYNIQIPRKNDQFRICIKSNGTIISSAGAILTPLLLFKSGIGPKKSVKNSGAYLYKDVPELGQNLIDRALIPINVFLDGEMPENGFPPSIAQTIGITQIGPNCTNVQFSDLNTDCSTVTAEGLSGSNIAEGTMFSTRVLLPPYLRNDSVVVRDCSKNVIPLNTTLLQPLCLIARPVSDCFKRLVSNFYFTAQPKSVGEIYINDEGLIKITANYLNRPEDLKDAVRGIGNIIRSINSGYYEGLIQKASLRSCPLTILNGLLAIVTQGLVKYNSSYKLRPESEDINFTQLRSHLEMQLENYDNYEKTKESNNQKFSDYIKQNYNLNETVQNICNNENENVCLNKNYVPFNYTGSIKENWFNMFGDIKFDENVFWQKQKYATYPPVIPDIKGLEEFAKTWMTSIWHWVGSARMGKVVNNDFKIDGIKNFAIVDASVLGAIPRMNPTLTIMALGRYAGIRMTNSEN